MQVHKRDVNREDFLDITAVGGRQFEIVENSAGYAKGDIVISCEYDQIAESLTGRLYIQKITHTQHGSAGLVPGYIVIQLKGVRSL